MGSTKRSIKTYGWTPDLPDHRDFKFTAAKAVKIPDHVDLRDKFKPTILDQGQLGSCVSNAISSAVQFEQFRQKEVPFASSRLFIYYNARNIEGTLNEDSGAMIRDGIKTVANLGSPPEVYWPYKIPAFTTKPTPEAYTIGAKHRAIQYQSLQQTQDSLTGCIAQGYPFVFGFSVYDAFESDAMARTGILNLPKKGEKLLGGHAVLAESYNLKQRRFLCQNSWGVGWGIKGAGYFTIPFDYILNPDLADDFWVIKSVD